jgi:hypothetical protein
MSKEKTEKCEKIACKPHHFIVTGWNTKGGSQNATHLRCAQCMMPVNLEQLESQEWKDKQGF